MVDPTPTPFGSLNVAVNASEGADVALKMANKQNGVRSEVCSCGMCDYFSDVSVTPESVVSAADTGDFHFIRHAVCHMGSEIINCSDEDGMTALHSASRNGHVIIVKYLLESIASTASVSQHSESDEPGSMSLYLDRVHGASFTSCRSSPCQEASASTEELNSLSRTTEQNVNTAQPRAVGKEPDVKHSDSDHSTSRTTAETQPCHVEFSSVIDNTSTVGTDVKSYRSKSKTSAWAQCTTRKGHTALHWAALKGHAPVIQELLEWGFDVNAVSKQGATPLQLAVSAKRLAVVKILISHGANADLRTTSGSYPTKVAVQLGDRAMREALKVTEDMEVLR